MEYTVLLRSGGGRRYVATVPALPGCSGEGGSREQALANVRAAIAEMMAEVEVVRVNVEQCREERVPSPDPWVELIGQFGDDPAFDPMMRAIYRERSGEYPA